MLTLVAREDTPGIKTDLATSTTTKVRNLGLELAVRVMGVSIELNVG